MSSHTDAVRRHYAERWLGPLTVVPFRRGPLHELPKDFAILQRAPSPERHFWTYCTQGMSQPGDTAPLELHMFSSVQADNLVEGLVAAAHFHRTGKELGLHHTINFGVPWCSGSPFDHGFISLPYLDGSALEWLEVENMRVRCLWLIAISRSEKRFKQAQGVDALEGLMESTSFAYADPFRAVLA